MMKKLFKYFVGHKIIAGVMALIIIGGGYFSYQQFKDGNDEVQYITQKIQTGPLVTSVTGSGQVLASNQIDIKSKTAGDVVYVGAKNGQEVKKGSLIIQLDTQDAQKAVRDAEINLESAKLDLEKLIQPADELSILQAENDLAQAKESKQNAEGDLEEAYEDGFNAVANAFLDLPTVMTGIQDTLFSDTVAGNDRWNLNFYSDAIDDYNDAVDIYKNNAIETYQTADDSYEQNFAVYKSTSRFSEKNIIEVLIEQTHNTAKNTAEAVKSSNNFIQLYQEELTEHNRTPHSLSNTHLLSLNTYTGTINSHLSSLLAIRHAIESNKEDIINAERNIAEKEGMLKELKEGPDELEVASQEIAIKQRKNALLDAKEDLSDYYIYSLFDGVVADIGVQKGESVGSNIVLVTIITNQKIAEISLNEIEMANIEVGQEATLTFDAVENLLIAGEVVEIDTIGMVTQGVVNYGVEVAFGTQDERIKPSMSVSVTIISEMKEGVFSVPIGAVKTQRNINYVEILINGKPEMRQVETGISNDIMIEIISGIKEGDDVITRTITDGSSVTNQTNGGFMQPPSDETQQQMRMMRQSQPGAVNFHP